MKQAITVSAPGKLMLMGEHAVVYGRPCIVTAVGQRMKATVSFSDDSEFQLEASDVQVINYRKPLLDIGKGNIPKGAQFVELAIKNFHDRYPIKRGIKVEIVSGFSSKLGFGSSSASTVCVLKALSELTGKGLDNKTIFDLAYKTILDIQGKGSGFDVAAAIYGGTLYFVTGGKVIEPLGIDELPLIIGYSGIKADTVSLINSVSEKAKKNPEEVEHVYNEIEKLVQKGKEALTSKNWREFGALMNKNHEYLQKLGVSTKKLDNMVEEANKAGAFGAKLSGAGGGDCIVGLCLLESREKVQKEIDYMGGKVININTNVQGTRIES